MTVDVKRNLLMLRTMNPKVVCQEEADRCKWAADTIELLANTLASIAASDISVCKRIIHDRRVADIIDAVIP